MLDELLLLLFEADGLLLCVVLLLEMLLSFVVIWLLWELLFDVSFSVDLLSTFDEADDVNEVFELSEAVDWDSSLLLTDVVSEIWLTSEVSTWSWLSALELSAVATELSEEYAKVLTGILAGAAVFPLPKNTKRQTAPKIPTVQIPEPALRASLIFEFFLRRYFLTRITRYTPKIIV